VFVERLEPSGQHLEVQDTARLVMRIQAGDREAFSLLYLRYFDRVFAYLRLALSSLDDAEDGAQQVFLKVLDALPCYQIRRQPFRAWLFVIVRNHALKELAKRGRAELADPAELDRRREAAHPDPELPALDWITDRELLIFIERLPLAQRQVLMLRYMLDLTTAEIAEVLGRSPVDVRSLQSRAVRFLRARLAALGRTAPERGRIRMRGCLKQARVIGARRWALRA
jgi:RNA polymerase sigma-70 factor (ECF subfamily)